VALSGRAGPRVPRQLSGEKRTLNANAAATRAGVLILIPIRECIGRDFVVGNVKISFRAIASLLLISVAKLFAEGRY
jgi:hypothetical protein